jgi:hypothetical protein
MLEIIAALAILASITIGPMLADHLLDRMLRRPSHYERKTESTEHDHVSKHAAPHMEWKGRGAIGQAVEAGHLASLYGWAWWRDRLAGTACGHAGMDAIDGL